MAISIRPILPRRWRARSAATSRKIPADRTPSNTASPPITCSGLEVVLPDGEIVALGGPVDERCGYDLVGAVVGSEGTCGMVTAATLRLMREPEASHHPRDLCRCGDATAAVSKIIASGMIPGAIEMMDRLILQAVEAAFHVGFSPDAGAVLIVEIDGLEVGLDERAAAAIDLMRTMRRDRSQARAR